MKVVDGFTSHHRRGRCQLQQRRFDPNLLEPLSALPHVQAIVVDNASEDNGLSELDGLPIERIALNRNAGFAAGCNVGWRPEAPRGALPEPRRANRDGRSDAWSSALDENPAVGAAGPRSSTTTGHSVLPEAISAHLLDVRPGALSPSPLPRVAWADEMVRNEALYVHGGGAEWISGSVPARPPLRPGAGRRMGRGVLHVLRGRRPLSSRVEDGSIGAFVPGATVEHVGGQSAPRETLLPELAGAASSTRASTLPEPSRWSSEPALLWVRASGYSPVGAVSHSAAATHAHSGACVPEPVGGVGAAAQHSEQGARREERRAKKVRPPRLATARARHRAQCSSRATG